MRTLALAVLAACVLMGCPRPVPQMPDGGEPPPPPDASTEPPDASTGEPDASVVLVWNSADLGSPAQAGAFSTDGGSFIVRGSGVGARRNDINHREDDQLHFAYAEWTGDFELIARLTFIGGDAGTPQAGLMVRAPLGARPALDVRARTAATFLSLGTMSSDVGRGFPVMNEFRIASRVTDVDRPNRSAGAQLAIGTYFHGEAPLWLRLQRVGTDFAASRSFDGVLWTPMGFASGELPGSTVLVGLFAAGGDDSPAGLTEARFDQVTVRRPRLPYTTSWVGSSAVAASTGDVPSYADSFYVAPDGHSYKYTATIELGQNVRGFDADGRVLKVWSPGFGGSGVRQGAVTGDGTHVYFGVQLADRYCINMLTPDLDPEVSCPMTFQGRMGGLAVRSAGGVQELYVSEENQVRVIDRATLATSLRTFAVPRAGPLAVDDQGFVWVVQGAAPFPLPFNYDVDAGLVPAVRAFTAAGVATGSVITDVVNPAGIAFAPSPPRLLVAENGPAQNVRIYPLSGTPTVAGVASTFGQAGGVYAGIKGRLVDPAAGGAARFYAPYGVGADSAGDLYVASGGVGADIRKLAPDGTLRWGAYGLLSFVSPVVFDPDTDGRDLYSTRAHFGFDVDRKGPGSEWSFQAVTFDPFSPADPSARERDEHGVIARRSGSPRLRSFAGGRFLYVLGDSGADPDGPTGFHNAVQSVAIYRFDGEIAVPCGAVSVEKLCGDPDPLCDVDPLHSGRVEGSGVMTLWVDSDGDGVRDAAEVTSTLSPMPSSGDFSGCHTANTCPVSEDSCDLTAAQIADPGPPEYFSNFDVDADGDIWLVFNLPPTDCRLVVPGGAMKSTALWRLHRTGMTAQAKPSPTYSLSYSPAGTGPRQLYPLPAPIATATAVKLEPGGALYLAGGSGSGPFTVARFDGWLSGQRSPSMVLTPPVPAAADEFTLTDAGVSAPLSRFMFLADRPQMPALAGVGFWYAAFDVAGDKLFLAHRFGPIDVYEADGGSLVTSLFAGPEASGVQGFQEHGRGIAATRRSNGEYLIATTDITAQGRSLVFRWKP